MNLNSQGKPAETTFVTVIEAGPLENQVVLLAKSLRAMESPLAGSDFVAVQPRRDVGLSPEARADLRALGVQIVSENLTTAYRWNPHLNKCAAMKWAERNVGTDFVTWLDGDMVFLRDPVPLVPRAGVSFMARAGEIDQGTDGSDVNAAYWDEVSRILGLDHRDAALIDSVPPAKPIYEYYQSGLYTLAREERISHVHHDFFVKLISANIASGSCGTYHHDQVCLAMAVRLSKGERACYPWEMNYNFNNIAISAIDPEMLARSYVLHYHGSFYPESYPLMVPYFAHLPPEVVALIEAHAPFGVRMPLDRRLVRKLRAKLRSWQYLRHSRSCATI